jgi:YidC/Oxa1 family membrane protein insertase
MQAPVFLALFHVLRLVGTSKQPALWEEYHWTQAQALSAGQAKLFGAPIAAAFRTPIEVLNALGGNPTSTKIVSFVLIVLMCAATFITQKQIMARSGQVLEGQQAMIQKFLLYGMPISLFVSGFLFPIGVLLYWFTNNLWTMGQQFYILKRMPHPSIAKQSAKPSVDAKLLAPKPGQKPVNPKRRPSGKSTSASTPGAAARPPAASSDESSPDGSSPPAAASASAAGSNSPDGDTAANPPAAPAPGPTSAPRPGRRPPNQRSSTKTRPKKKRR